ncbi:sigma-70 family RNA polymerase sigma factor [Intestinibacter sp.]|uniref:sigma-70 family RNA polymerase sigma factor n=1 Tax=Intestinibacter sp. TaxID=1965304 RepID=UPI002A748A1B|nr:sigma-70 family RNA polymerase sigma factor [Intestinibacter sp.]MDY2734967.1 sigma-70 family RNA polymerase sigma factor [Intestinibacter sp.]
MNELFDLVKNYQETKNEESFLLLLKKFNPLIKNLSNKSIYPDMKNELTLFFTELVNKPYLLNLNSKNDKCLSKYIGKSMHNYFQKINKHYEQIIKTEPTEFKDSIYTNTINSFNTIEFKDFLNYLSPKEKEIILYYFNDLYTCTEISKKYNVSRQYIHKILKRSLKKLKIYYSCEIF